MCYDLPLLGVKYGGMRVTSRVRRTTVGAAFPFSKRVILVLAVLVAALGMPVDAGAAIAFGSSTTATNGGSSNTLVITQPAGMETGDVLVAQITFEKGSDIDPLTAPDGWTLELLTNSGTDIGQAIYYKVITNAGTEPASYTWTFSQTAKAGGAILRYSGVDATDPTVASAGSTGASGNLDAPSVTADAGSFLLALYGIKKDTTLSTPAGMNQRATTTSTGNDIRILAADELRAGAGLTGIRTSTPAVEDKWVAQSMTLRPVPPGSFYTLAPCRLVDTRETSPTPPPIGGPALVSGETRLFAAAGLCGVPTDARVVSVNMTVVTPSGAGTAVLYRGDLAEPTPVISIAFNAGVTRANNGLVELDATGAFAATAHFDGDGTVHLVVDVNGYFD